MPLSSARVRATVAATVTAVGVGLVSPPAAGAAASDGTGSTYTNPVSKAFADTYADPSVIRGKDGWWYAYGTTDPLREGEGTRHLLPMSKSTDLVHWQYVGDAFSEATMPTWADKTRGASLWAPDIRYVDGQYRLYYVVTETTVTDEPNDNAIGVAFSDSPTGPWTDSGDPVVGPRRGGAGEPGNFLWTFDPHMVVGPGGTEYLYYGSYYGGIWVTELTDDGSEATGEPTMVAIDNKYEGAYVVQRNGWWYLFASSANCCAGPTTGYSVHVGRSRSVTGPFVDREGVPLNQSRAGGTPVLFQNGNTWVGSGHNAIATDLAGQDWILYHAIDRADPYLDEPGGINERPMLIDRLDWIDGWPIARAGAGPSQGPQPGPITGGSTVTDFSRGIGGDWVTDGVWKTVSSDQAGTSIVSTANGQRNTVLSRASMPADVRVEADVRRSAGARGGEYGLQAAVRTTDGSAVSAVLDPATDAFLLRTTDGAQGSAALPAGFSHEDWHSLALEVRGGVATAELTNARLGDPLATLSLALPAGRALDGRAGAVAQGAGAQVDNLSALKAAGLVTQRIPGPRPGTLLAGPSDEFNGRAPERGWTSVRDTSEVTVSGGQLNWPVEDTDLVGTTAEGSNDAGILLRDAPAGNWTVETKLTIDLGVDEIRNFQQGGLIAYVNDDLFTRLSHVAIWNTRQTEFGKEMPYPDKDNQLSYGGTIIGPPADTTWLRITHRTDPDNGEHELQASTSRDGQTWVVGGVWTLPTGSTIRIGLISHGLQGAGVPATSQFDYFRVYSD
jgi:arabinan endo-1,5-alpha-L-arabinosidase